MPDIADEVRKDLEARLKRFLTHAVEYGEPTYVGSGGSAAIFRVPTTKGEKAIKVYDPRFFDGDNAKVEGKRLALQRTLIGHDCPTLVGVNRVEEAEGTAFIEMEFVAWPQLKKVLSTVPDDKVSILTRQLVDAVVFLEQLGVVHRDVKPENIHVSEDFSQLKLIDLGVARTLSASDEECNDGTDNGHRRPFIATAQYSSPEYLFRLDAPSPNLWKALNLYQVGAVLHDLINKKPIFQDEVEIGNRFVVAKAVLTKIPTFPDTDSARLATQKALASRCLVKDMATRLQIVGWNDFTFEAPTSPLSSLTSRLAKGKSMAGSQAAAAHKARLEFDRERFCKRFCEAIRSELISAVEQAIQITLAPAASGSNTGYVFQFELAHAASVSVDVSFEWFEDLQCLSTKVSLGGVLHCGAGIAPQPEQQEVAVATIGESESVVTHDVANRVAEVLTQALDMLDATSDRSAIHGCDVGKLCLQKS